MPTLAPALHSARLALDYRSTMPLVGDVIPSIVAYANGAARTPVTDTEGERGRATVYVVDYAVKHLIGAGTFGDRCRVRFDLGAVADYPFTAPSVFVTSTPRPWTPHVLASNGLVCLGEVWSAARGKMLLAQLLVHVARILNFDEPDRGPDYFGWNPAAIGYWRTVMRCRPVTPDLRYPMLPREITHTLDAPEAAGGLRRLAASPSPPPVAADGLRRVATGLKSASSSGATS